MEIAKLNDDDWDLLSIHKFNVIVKCLSFQDNLVIICCLDIPHLIQKLLFKWLELGFQPSSGIISGISVSTCSKICFQATSSSKSLREELDIAKLLTEKFQDFEFKIQGSSAGSSVDAGSVKISISQKTHEIALPYGNSDDQSPIGFQKKAETPRNQGTSQPISWLTTKLARLFSSRPIKQTVEETQDKDKNLDDEVQILSFAASVGTSENHSPCQPSNSEYADPTSSERSLAILQERERDIPNFDHCWIENGTAREHETVSNSLLCFPIPRRKKTVVRQSVSDPLHGERRTTQVVAALSPVDNEKNYGKRENESLRSWVMQNILNLHPIIINLPEVLKELDIIAEQEIGPSGGTVEVRSFQANFPENAVKFNIRAELWIRTDCEKSGLPQNVIPIAQVVNCSPEGIEFDRPVLLKIPTWCKNCSSDVVPVYLYSRHEDGEWRCISTTALGDSGYLTFYCPTFCDNVPVIDEEDAKSTLFEMYHYLSHDAIGNFFSCLCVSDESLIDRCSRRAKESGQTILHPATSRHTVKLGEKIHVKLTSKYPEAYNYDPNESLFDINARKKCETFTFVLTRHEMTEDIHFLYIVGSKISRLVARIPVQGSSLKQIGADALQPKAKETFRKSNALVQTCDKSKVKVCVEGNNIWFGSRIGKRSHFTAAGRVKQEKKRRRKKKK